MPAREIRFAATLSSEEYAHKNVQKIVDFFFSLKEGKIYTGSGEIPEYSETDVTVNVNGRHIDILFHHEIVKNRDLIRMSYDRLIAHLIGVKASDFIVVMDDFKVYAYSRELTVE